MSQTEPPAVATVDRLIAMACQAGASDLHIDPSEDGIEVRMRKDGALHQMELLPIDMRDHLVGRFKALADLLAYRTDVPQEGRIPSDRLGLPTDLRVATFPTVFGERIAVRFASVDAGPCALDELGFDDHVGTALRKAIEEPDGVVLVTGPSGSGKTTTLYACLRHLVDACEPRAIVTVEDPVEQRVRRITQTQVDPTSGLDFARALRSLLRQDPEVLLVGEIRDHETAKIALEAGLTGHLVASTVHAGTAPLVFARLLEMGIEPFVLTTAVRGVLAQRLVRKNCDAPTCADDGSDCAKCGGSGYSGRFPIAEWLPMTSEVRRAVLARGDGESVTVAAAASDCISLRACAEAAVRDGKTTEEEVQRVLGHG